MKGRTCYAVGDSEGSPDSVRVIGSGREILSLGFLIPYCRLCSTLGVRQRGNRDSQSCPSLLFYIATDSGIVDVCVSLQVTAA